MSPLLALLFSLVSLDSPTNGQMVAATFAGQWRTDSPDGLLAGCDLIVMGRPITRAADPVAAYRQAKRDFLG